MGAAALYETHWLDARAGQDAGIDLVAQGFHLVVVARRVTHRGHAGCELEQSILLAHVAMHVEQARQQRLSTAVDGLRGIAVMRSRRFDGRDAAVVQRNVGRAAHHGRGRIEPAHVVDHGQPRQRPGKALLQFLQTVGLGPQLARGQQATLRLEALRDSLHPWRHVGEVGLVAVVAQPEVPWRRIDADQRVQRHRHLASWRGEPELGKSFGADLSAGNRGRRQARAQQQLAH